MKITDDMRRLAAQQCPNCGNWYRLGSCFHSSSGPFGTLYGVCQKCADQHREWAKVTQRLMDMMKEKHHG